MYERNYLYDFELASDYPRYKINYDEQPQKQAKINCPHCLTNMLVTGVRVTTNGEKMVSYSTSGEQLIRNGEHKSYACSKCIVSIEQDLAKRVLDVLQFLDKG